MTLPWRIFTVTTIITGAAGLFHVYITVMTTGAAPFVAALISLAVLLIGCVALYVHEKPAPTPQTRPYVHVDWALTDVCIHVSCPCTPTEIRHLDGYTFGQFRCPDCGNRFELPTKLEAHRLTT